jgi:hypothetical protein
MIEKRAIAFCDILGFKDKIFRENLRDFSEKYEKAIKISNDLLKPFKSQKDAPRLFPKHDLNKPWCEKNIFSDAIILISHSSSEEDILKLMVYTWRLSQAFLSMGLPFRGGIVYDDMYFNKVSGIVLGKALTLAYELEQAQDWIGVSIDNSVLKELSAFKKEIENKDSFLGRLFPRYLVPCKGGATMQLHVISWRFNLVVKNGTRSLFDVRGDQTAINKIEKTLAFAKFYKENFRILSNQKETPIEIRIFFCGDAPTPFDHGDDL